LDKHRVAIITPARFPGTAGDTANYSEIINQLLRNGFEVLLICPESGSVVTESLANFDIIRIPCRPPRLNEIKNGIGFKTYLRLFLFLIIESLVVLWILKHRKIKYAYMRHSILTMQLPILLKLIRIKTIADGELITDWMRQRVNPKFFRLLRFLEKKIFNLYSYYKVSSQMQAENLLELRFLPKNRILLIPVSINIDRIPKFSIEEISPHTFGYFGALEEWQGVDLLLHGFALLLRNLPTATLYIIGDGSMKNRLKDIVLQKDLSSNVIFVDGISREVLWYNYFTKFRIVMIPRVVQNDSTDSVLPIKLVESLAAGKPTIATDIPVMREIPKNPILLTPSGSPILLAEAMESLSTNNTKLKEYSEASLACAINYDIKLNIKKLIHVLGNH